MNNELIKAILTCWVMVVDFCCIIVLVNLIPSFVGKRVWFIIPLDLPLTIVCIFMVIMMWGLPLIIICYEDSVLNLPKQERRKYKIKP